MSDHMEHLAQASHTLVVETSGPGFTEITAETQDWLRTVAAEEGLLTVFIRHTSASLTIQENADPDVRRDLADALDGLAPETAAYRHTIEGPDDMPAHIKAMVTSTSLNVPVRDGRAVLGTWQGLFLIEHRALPHRREVALHFLGTRNGGRGRTQP